MNYVFQLGDAPGNKQLGGKATALAVLQDCGGVLIPEWFVVLPSAFESSVSGADRQALSEQADQVANQHLPARINLAPAVMQELREALAHLSPAGELVAAVTAHPALREHTEDFHSTAQVIETKAAIF